MFHFGLVTFRFAYGKDRIPIMFMISGFLDVSLSPKTNIIYLLRPQGTSINSRKHFNEFKKSDVHKPQILEMGDFEKFEKAGAEQSRRFV